MLLHQTADVDGTEPVDVLLGVDGFEDPLLGFGPMVFGRGACTSTPSCTALRLSRSTTARTSLSAAEAGSRSRSARMPTSAAARSLFRT